MKKYKNCFITLKSGILKSYWFSDEFIKNNKILFDELENVWNEIYENDCCVFGASQTIKNNYDLKTKLCDTLDKFYDLNIKIINGWDNKIYKNKNNYRNCILSYGEEV